MRPLALAVLLLAACEPIIGLDDLEFVLPPSQSSTSSAPPGDERLVLAMGGEGSDSFGGLDVDGDRRLLVAGTFESTLDLGAGALTSDGGDDFFVAAFDSTGAPAWQAQLGGAGDQSSNSAAATPNAAWAADGEATLFGPYAGTITLGGEDFVAGDRDLFVARFEASGARRWFLQATGEGPEDGAGLAVHGDGGVSLAAINASAPLELGDEMSSTPTTALLHARVSADGTVASVEGFASPAAGLGVASLDDGGVVLAGHTAAPVADFDCGPLSGDDQDAVVVRLASNGACEWSYRFDGTGTSSARAVVADGQRALVAGRFDGSLAGPDGSASCAAGTCGFVAALTLASEELVWLRAIDGGSGSAIEPRDLAHGETLWVVGTFAGTLDGPDGSWSAQGTDGFALELDPSSGEVLGGFALGGTGQDRLLAVALDSAGLLVLGGDYESSGVSIADLTLPAPRERDLFILRVQP